ncbi:hydrogenase maturation protein [Neptuniibacter sp.]|uniref:hydrogenase maturation protein n=1 Tax=Neptuniibacter sp. TaxID=1962643 RepID=UPI0026181D8F|nr:hydrogenase maturation protein [Neptuniibacter sp.]MCP4598841.1 hydrogenase maturation protein [Neptuniibacter sp.]
MRILFLTHGFNSLTQRLFVELRRDGHEVSIEFDINDEVAEEAVELFKPELILAPFLKRAIPESIWKKHRCIIVHPGIKGDRGPSSVDWAIMNGEEQWGVTCLEATAEMDAGDIWESVEFPLRDASKSSLYRNEVTDAAVAAVKLTLKRIESGDYQPEPLDYTNPEIRGQWNCLMQQKERQINWQLDDTETVLRKINAADSMPGVKDLIGGKNYFLYNAYAEVELGESKADSGSILATRDGAICFKTIDAAVWVTHLKIAEPAPDEFAFKLPATHLLGEKLNLAPEEMRVQEITLQPEAIPESGTWQEIRYREEGEVGYIYFDFYNGAMDTEQCQRLQKAITEAKKKPIKLLVLMGGEEFWSNGIHLNQIEAAESPAEESWRNINAMNDLCLEIINTPNQLTMVAMRGNAGAGGVFMALAADQVYARGNVILNPHYKSMGNLYGSEYWTYLLPKRVGEDNAQQLMQNRHPLSAAEAEQLGLIDVCLNQSREGFVQQISSEAQQLANCTDHGQRLAEKNLRRQHDELQKPLSNYRAEELEQMKLNFFGFDPSYHVARYHFVEKLPKARTPAYLASHRKI